MNFTLFFFIHVFVELQLELGKISSYFFKGFGKPTRFFVCTKGLLTTITENMGVTGVFS